MSFYTFRQNNSGGGWDGPRYVCVEADSADEANNIATEHGVYFNGVANNEDCECCGDRWWRVDESDATDEPSVYGRPFADTDNVKIVRKARP